MLMTEIPEGWMAAQETEKHCSLVQFSCSQGIAGMGALKRETFQSYKLRKGKKFTKLKFLEGDVLCVCCKVKPWADSTAWVMSSPIALLHVFVIVFKEICASKTKSYG